MNDYLNKIENHEDKDVIKFLMENGYTSLNTNPRLTDAKWAIFKRGVSEVLCQCNDKPPQFHIERFKGTVEVNHGEHIHNYDYFEIKIWGETNIDTEEDSKGIWFNSDLKCSKEQLMNNLADIERRCTLMWEALNSQK